MISLTNKTRYNTKFLQRILGKALKYWQKEMKPLPRYLNCINITVVPARQSRGVSGYAWPQTSLMKLKIPYYSTNRSPVVWNGLSFIQDLIFVFYHELMHNIGHSSHLEINDKYLMKCAVDSGINLPWEYALVKEAKQFRLQKDLREARYQKALKMVEKWEKKVKTGNLRLKQWQKKVKYYNKALSKKGE